MNCKGFKYWFCIGIFGLTASLFSGCREEYQEPPVDYLPQDFKDWMFFKEGTYWVYQDSVTGALDSTVVTRTESEIFSIDNEARKSKRRVIKKVERLSYDTYSFATGKKYKYISSDRCPASPNYQTDQCLYLHKIRIPQETYTGGADLIFYNMPVGFYLSAVFLKAKYDSLQVGKRYYKDVVLNWNPANSNEGGVESWYYLAKGIGVVQLRQNYNGRISTQKLIRYHIVQ